MALDEAPSLSPRARRLLLAGGALAALLLALGVAAYAPDRPVEELSRVYAAPGSGSRFVELDGIAVHLRDGGARAAAGGATQIEAQGLMKPGAPAASNAPNPGSDPDPVPIVLIHGTSASLHTWDGWAQALEADGRRVVRFDLPGFGLTGPNLQNDYSIDAYVRFVRLLLDRLEIGRAVVAGNSLGGQIAWNFAAAYPERVEALVLVDASGYPLAPESVPLGFRIARTPLLREAAPYLLSRRLIRASIENVYGDPSKVSDDLVERYYLLTLREGNRRALLRRFEQGYAGDTAALRRLRVPTLILWGGRDRLIPPSHAERFAADIALAQKVVFPALGHVPHEEDPQATVAVLRRFLGLSSAPR
jgi:pimeloyl-ACP methyl ester carboxylesterase